MNYFLDKQHPEYIFLQNNQKENSYKFVSLKNIIIRCLQKSDNFDSNQGCCLSKAIPVEESFQLRAKNNQTITTDLSFDTTFYLGKLDHLKQIKGKSLYCGPLYDHFGHFMSESIHRLWAYHTQIDIQNIIFLPFINGPNNIDQALDYQKQLFDYFKIPQNKIILLKDDVIVDDLIIPTQASVLGPRQKASIKYIRFLSRFQHFSNQTSLTYEKVFVSRCLLGPKGMLAAESWLEKIFEYKGFKIFYPENHSLSHQLYTYSQAKDIIFIEGSSIHCLEPLGSIKAKITLLSRGGFIEKQLMSFLSVISTRTDNWELIRGGRRLPTQYKGISDKGEIVPAFRQAGHWYTHEEIADILFKIFAKKLSQEYMNQYTFILIKDLLTYWKHSLRHLAFSNKVKQSCLMSLEILCVYFTHSKLYLQNQFRDFIDLRRN